MNYIETLVATALVAAISDWVIQTFKKSPSHIIAPFIRLWKENSHLHNILYKADKNFGKIQINRFARWRDKYVALKANRLEKDVGKETIAIDILRECIKNSTPVILTGDPGSGKTTTLEALTYQIAASSYKINIFFWLGFLFPACILLFFSPLATFLYIISFFLWEPLVTRTPIPIFVEARYLTDEISNMGKWCDEQRQEKIGSKPLFGSPHRIAWLIDGADELTSETLYANFINGWRKLLQDNKVIHAFFSNRILDVADLSNRLGIKSIIKISELDDNLVKRFLHSQEEFKKLESEQLLAQGSIGRNPYWLQMIIDGGAYTKNKGKVIYGYIENLLTRETYNTTSAKSDDFIPKDDLLLALANLGMTLEKENLFGLVEKGAFRAMKIMETGVGNQYKGKYIFKKSLGTSLLRQDGEDKIFFAHPFIQTFFAAYDLYRGDDWKQKLHLTDDFRWWRAFLFLGDLIADQSIEKFENLLETIIGEGENIRRVYLTSAILENTLPFRITNIFESTSLSNAGFLEWLEENLSPESTWDDLFSSHSWVFSVSIEQKIMSGLLKGIRNQNLDEHKVSITQSRELQGDTILERLASYFSADDYRHPQIAQTTIRIFQSLGDKKASECIVLMLGYEKIKDVAYDALVKMGESVVEPLVKSLGYASGLQNRTPDYRIVQNLLCGIGENAVPELSRFLKSNSFDWSGKSKVAETLGIIGGNDAINALIALLHDPLLATIVYSPLIKNGEAAFDALFKLSNSDNVVASLNAHVVLEKLDRKMIFERLVNLVGHIEFSFQSIALLLRLLDEQPDKKKIVFSIVDKGDMIVSAYLLPYLLEMGDSAIDELVSRLSDSRSYLPIHSALLSLGQNAIKPLVGALMTRDHKIRKEILQELIDLAILGIVVDQIMEELLNILMQEDTNQADKSSLVAMLVTLGKPAVSSLGKLLGNENAPYWSHVFYSLYLISTKHYIAPEPLLKTLKSANEKTRMAVMMTFMAGGNPLFLPYLLVEIPHASKEWRKFFIQMLPRYLIKSTKAILEYPKYLREQRDHKKAIAKLQNVIDRSVLQTSDKDKIPAHTNSLAQSPSKPNQPPP